MKTDPNISPTAPGANSKLSPAEKARELLEREPSTEIQRQWTQFYAAREKAAAKARHSVVVFRLGPEWLALATSVFQEITGVAPIHSLPHRKKDVVLGVVRVRGELLICVSLASVLGIQRNSSEKEERQSRLVVLGHAGSRLVFPADEVHGIHHLTEDLAPVPSTVSQAAITYTKGLFSWQEKTVGCLDHELLFHTLNRNLA